MTIQLVKAQRNKAYLKLGMSAPSGAGKTLGSLLLAYGMMKEKYPNLPENSLWEKIAIIDSENGSGALETGKNINGITIGRYNIASLTPPFTVDEYTNAIEICEQAGIEVCIIDSITHAWSGVGGLLEEQSNVAKRTGNSYSAWRDVTPKHNRFVDKMLQTPMHIIATMRAKQEYVQERDERTGKTTVRKLGMEPEQRKGMEFEFTVFLEINADHQAFGAKDRTSLLDQQTFLITPKTGASLMKWLENGEEPVKQSVVIKKSEEVMEEIQPLYKDVIDLCIALGGKKNESLMLTIPKYTPDGSANPNTIKDVSTLKKLKEELLTIEKVVV